MEAPDAGLGGSFARVLGLRWLDDGPDGVAAEMEVRQEHCNSAGIMHGGALVTFADTLGGRATGNNLGEGERSITIESKTNFLRAVRPGMVLRGECLPLHRGSRTMVWMTRLTAGDGAAVAVVVQTQLTLR
jgi:uncharacterized protein (TIGR00369 family)